MIVEKVSADKIEVDGTWQTKTTVCGNILELAAFSKVNRAGSQIYNLGERRYCHKDDVEVDYQTGEVTIPEECIKEFKEKAVARVDNLQGLRRSMKAVRDLINCNVVNPVSARWITLTYAENMTDPKRLYTDRGAFWKRVKRWCTKNDIAIPEYISVVEPQARGAWHLHELWIFPDKAPFLENEVVRNLWSFGFVTVRALENVDNVGAYLTAYLCDIPLEEAEAGTSGTVVTKQFAENGKQIEKKFVKGGRLHLYPAGMNFYRTSRGVARPDVSWTSYGVAKENVDGLTSTFERGLHLSDGEGFESDIKYEYYNRVRKK